VTHFTPFPAVAVLVAIFLVSCGNADSADPNVTLSIQRDADHGDDYVVIRHRDWPRSTWTLRVPEYMIIHHEVDREVTVEGERDAETGAIALTAAGGDGGSTVEIVVVPGRDRVDITATATNTGAAPWDSSAKALACLVFADAPAFFDHYADHTWVHVEGGLHTIDELRHDYPQRVPLHNNHPLRERDMDWYSEKRRNNRAIRAESSLIIRSDRSNRRHVGFAFDDAFAVAYNLRDPKLHCIHSDPRFGALQPGESRTLHGRIYFFTGSIEGLESQFRQDFPGLGYGESAR
jgi:hypothetical protein